MARSRFVLALLVAALLVPVARASAAPGDPFQYRFSFDGAGLPVALTEPGHLAVDEESGDVYVLDGPRLDRFNEDGEPEDFSALKTPQITPPEGTPTDVVVDNSGGANQGNIYLYSSDNYGTFWSYRPDGTRLNTGAPVLYEQTGSFSPCGIGVDRTGKIWYATNGFGEPGPSVQRLTPAGLATGEKYLLATPPETGLDNQCQPRFDRHGVMTVFSYGNAFAAFGQRYDSTKGFAFLQAFPFELTADKRQLQVDPSTGDAYGSDNYAPEAGAEGHGARVHDVPYTNPPESRTPIEALPGIEYANGLAFDGTGGTLYVSGNKRIDVYRREPPSPPRNLAPLTIEEVRSEGVRFSSSLIASGSPTSFSFEYGTTPALGASSPPIAAHFQYFPVGISGAIAGLAPNTTYYVRLAATNGAGTTYGETFVFKTYAGPGDGSDSCPNALARKQTGAATLPDCRAYELVSAADTGGYDVESSLAPGQTPFAGYPLASDRLLYATHSGAVPGPWNATNRGPDPYLAVRGAGGWTTTYEGLPADLDPRAGSFSSVLGEASADLGSFAFAGPGLCGPCFESGLATGIPVRLASGALVQGMAGSLAGSVPASARPEGMVDRYLSADGRHLVFASKYAFEPGANSGGDLTVYDRDLAAGTTQIVSTDSGGAVLTGAGISELGLSADGSRIVTAKRVGVDSAGNEYVHPYLHLGGAKASVDLAPGTTSGVLFAGMTADGSAVFFTTVDTLLAADTDKSADLYVARVGPEGGFSLSLLGGADPGDACDPVANSAGPHWNTVGSGANCDTVAIAGGGGIAGAAGTAYFLSPQRLDGALGTADQPNLYREGAGAAPVFVATLEPDNPLVTSSVRAAATRRSGDFEVTPGGRFAAFRSSLPLGGVATHGLLSVFRYDAAGGPPVCVSCDLTGTTEARIPAEAQLAPAGLSLTEGGTVFFTTLAQLQLRDANFRRDVYASSGGEAQLISAGTGPFDSALLTVSASGNDAFFFTHDDLAPSEDRNGTLTRIYDARVGGGFFMLPAPVPCQASDECHGPSTVAPPPADIKSSGRTTRGNVLKCKKGKVKRHNRCVKRHRKSKAKRHHRSSGKRARGGSRG